MIKSRIYVIFLFKKMPCWLTETNLAAMHYQTNPYVTSFCITHLNPLNEEHRVLKNKIILVSRIYSNFDKHCILSHSIFWVVKICSRSSTPVKEMLMCSPSWTLLLSKTSVEFFHWTYYSQLHWQWFN